MFTLEGGSVILPKVQRTFFVKAVTFSQYLQNQIQNKLVFFYGISTRISSTLLLSELLLKSEFGDHPLAQEAYPAKSTKWANNLFLLETDGSWTDKVIKYEGKTYKAFKTWEDLGVHLTDMLVFRKQFDQYSLNRYLSQEYTKDKAEIILNYSLGDFEIGQEDNAR